MPRGIDHLVLAAHDLDAQAAFYRRLGFTVGARNRHSWGTLNHIVQFPGTFLELITTEPGFTAPLDADPLHSFAGFLSNYMAAREGLAMLVLESKDAKGDLAQFKSAGIAKPDPFFFERKGKRPDGSDVHVAFTLAFAKAPGVLDAGFFVCQQHFPENFWNPAFQKHENGVTRVSAVTFEASDVEAAAAFFGAFVDAKAMPSAAGIRVETGRGAIEIVNGVANRFTQVTFACPDLPRLGQILQGASIRSSGDEARIRIAAGDAFGVALVFEAGS